MKKINVEINSLITFLSSIIKIIPGNDTGVKFIISNDKTEVKVRNEQGTLRAFFTTNCMTSESNIEFCFKDIPKLLKSINMIKSHYNKELLNATIDFNDTFLAYNNTIKFKLKVIKDDELIKKYISPDLKAVLEPVYTFETSDSLVKKVIQYSSIVGDNTKIYFIEKDGQIIGEIDDKINQLTDSVGIPFGTLIRGEVTKVVATQLENFKSFATLPCDKIEVSFVSVGAFTLKSRFENQDKYIDLFLLCSQLKG